MPVHDVHPVLRAALGRVCAPVPEGRVLIHGRLYDLRHFDHPGGRVWTHMCDGCDATALFETHHLDAAAAWRVLRALPSRPAPSTALWRYDFVRYAKLRDAALHALPRRCDRGPTGAVRWATAGSAVGALLGHMWLLRCAGGQGTIRLRRLGGPQHTGRWVWPQRPAWPAASVRAARLEWPLVPRVAA
jgi:hypothetical protein